MKKILFLCTGNTCRSPMAQGIFNRLLAERGLDDFICESAGLMAFAGDPAEPNAMAAAAEHGADITAHRSRPMSDYMKEDTALFVCMTATHAALLADVPPEKVVVLAGGIPDPYGGDLEVYRACAAHIKKGLEDLLELLENQTGEEQK